MECLGMFWANRAMHVWHMEHVGKWSMFGTWSMFWANGAMLL